MPSSRVVLVLVEFIRPFVVLGYCGSWHDLQETCYHGNQVPFSLPLSPTHTHTQKQSCHFSNYIHDTSVKRLHYIITSTEDSPSCVANSSSTSQNILRIFWTLNSLPSSQDSATCPYSGPNRVHDHPISRNTILILPSRLLCVLRWDIPLCLTNRQTKQQTSDHRYFRQYPLMSNTLHVASYKFYKPKPRTSKLRSQFYPGTYRIQAKR